MSNKLESDNLTWDFDVNVFKLLGSQLISDKFTAIIELVKNSYDANATEVKIDFIDADDVKNGLITIQDNGFGMSKDDIKNKWMKIGTNNKRNSLISPKPFNRVLLGEKGIGRFAIEKIANYITLESKQLKFDVFHNLEINWNKYEELLENKKPPLFTSIINQYTSFKELKHNKITKQGTFLSFSSLKEPWSSKDIKRLKIELAKFISPVANIKNNKFNIFVKEGTDKRLFDVSEYQNIINNSLELATSLHKISFNESSNQQEELHWNEETNELEITNINKQDFGFIKMSIYWFNSPDKRKFKLAYKAKDISIDGFKIYRDGVLATPFVEIASTEEGVDKYRDILGIDKRRWSNFFGKISSHDFIGVIEITKQNNPLIKDLTSRQDFEDTSEYKKFKEFIINQLLQIEKKLIYEKEEEQNETSQKIKDARLKIDSIKESIESLIKSNPDLKKNIEPIYKNIQEVGLVIKDNNQIIHNLEQDNKKKEELYFSIMSLQEYAADLAHMISNSLVKILSISRFFVDNLVKTEFHSKTLMLDYEVKKLQEDANYMIDYAENGHKLKQFDLSELILKVFQRYDEYFEEKSIFLELPKQETFIITHNETFLRDIFNNLISNSIKALKSNLNKKIIKCTTMRNDDKFIILFSDNGIGIAEDNKLKIFDRYFSTTKEDNGAGIGLYVVRNNLKTLNGKIELIESEFGNIGCTFKIAIPIKKDELS